MQLPALNESTEAEELAILEDIGVTHDRQDEDLSKDNIEEGNTCVPGCQNALPPEIPTPSMVTAVESKPLDSLQEITEAEEPGTQEDNKRDIDKLMQEVAVYFLITSLL